MTALAKRLEKPAYESSATESVFTSAKYEIIAETVYSARALTNVGLTFIWPGFVDRGEATEQVTRPHAGAGEFDAKANLRQHISNLREPLSEDPKTLELAEAALQRLDKRNDENVELWAETLARDLARFRD